LNSSTSPLQSSVFTPKSPEFFKGKETSRLATKETVKPAETIRPNDTARRLENSGEIGFGLFSPREAEKMYLLQN